MVDTDNISTPSGGTPPAGTKYMPCRECRRPILVGINKRKAPRCLECGVAAQVAFNTQMAEKSGPLYDEWLRKSREALQRTLRGRGAGNATPPSLE